MRFPVIIVVVVLVGTVGGKQPGSSDGGRDPGQIVAEPGALASLYPQIQRNYPSLSPSGSLSPLESTGQFQPHHRGHHHHHHHHVHDHHQKKHSFANHNHNHNHLPESRDTPSSSRDSSVSKIGDGSIRRRKTHPHRNAYNPQPHLALGHSHNRNHQPHLGHRQRDKKQRGESGWDYPRKIEHEKEEDDNDKDDTLNLGLDGLGLAKPKLPEDHLKEEQQWEAEAKLYGDYDAESYDFQEKMKYFPEEEKDIQEKEVDLNEPEPSLGSFIKSPDKSGESFQNVLLPSTRSVKLSPKTPKILNNSSSSSIQNGKLDSDLETEAKEATFTREILDFLCPGSKACSECPTSLDACLCRISEECHPLHNNNKERKRGRAPSFVIRGKYYNLKKGEATKEDDENNNRILLAEAKPVCGSDGQLYSSRCDLLRAACLTKSQLFVNHSCNPITHYNGGDTRTGHYYYPDGGEKENDNRNLGQDNRSSSSSSNGNGGNGRDKEATVGPSSNQNHDPLLDIQNFQQDESSLYSSLEGITSGSQSMRLKDQLEPLYTNVDEDEEDQALDDYFSTSSSTTTTARTTTTTAFIKMDTRHKSFARRERSCSADDFELFRNKLFYPASSDLSRLKEETNERDVRGFNGGGGTEGDKDMKGEEGENLWDSILADGPERDKDNLVRYIFSWVDLNRDFSLDYPELHKADSSLVNGGFSFSSLGLESDDNCQFRDFLQFDDTNKDGRIHVTEFYSGFSYLYGVTMISLEKALEQKTILVNEGEDVVLRCDVAGSPPTPILWNRTSGSGRLSLSEIEEPFIGLVNNDHVRVNVDGTLEFVRVSSHLGGNYSCQSPRNPEVVQVHILRVIKRVPLLVQISPKMIVMEMMDLEEPGREISFDCDCQQQRSSSSAIFPILRTNSSSSTISSRRNISSGSSKSNIVSGSRSSSIDLELRSRQFDDEDDGNSPQSPVSWSWSWFYNGKLIDSQNNPEKPSDFLIQSFKNGSSRCSLKKSGMSTISGTDGSHKIPNTNDNRAKPLTTTGMLSCQVTAVDNHEEAYGIPEKSTRPIGNGGGYKEIVGGGWGHGSSRFRCSGSDSAILVLSYSPKNSRR